MGLEALPMNGGDGINSYAKNSNEQKGAFDGVKTLLVRCIQENVEIQKNSKLFKIGDLGCSVGPNTFLCVQTLIDALELKNSTDADPGLEFQVFFNDLVTNDFNTLFKNLPLDHNYLVAAVPGSFYSRLFPKGSMNFMISSYSLHWLTKVPDEVTRHDSPAWNKGKISYRSSSSKVEKAFSAQFSNDIQVFFGARAEELASGGLTAILMPCREEGTVPSESIYALHFERLGRALTDMVNNGIIKEELLDSFNVPTYFPSPSEVKEAVENCKILTVERAEIVYQDYNVPKDVPAFTRLIRAISEVILSKHFGTEIMDELFERFTQQMEEFLKTGAVPEKQPNLFLVVKRA